MAKITALSVQSLACHGKCSLTEALPIVSACGVSLSVLPTAVLSTHTGGFSAPSKLSTVDFFKDTLEHFKRENIRFDGIQTGYFADVSEIKLFINEMENLIKEDTLVVVDPVLGDRGKYFNGITEMYVDNMLKLCKKADVIVPNITEAFFLCGEAYNPKPTKNQLISLAVKLFNIAKAKVVITGIKQKGKIGSLVYDGDSLEFLFSRKTVGNFHGAGDIFVGVVFGKLLSGEKLKVAVKKAQSFISKSISATVRNESDERDGIDFEDNLIDLI